MNTGKYLSRLLAAALLSCMLANVALADEWAEEPAEENAATEATAVEEVSMVDWTAVEEPELRDTEMIELTDDVVLSEDDADAVIMEYDPALNAASGLKTELQQMLDISSQIRAALLSGATQIDLSGLKEVGITQNNEQFSHIGYYCPYLDGVNVKASAYYYSDGTYAYIKITNNLSASATQTWVNNIDAKLNELLALTGSSMSVADQALVLHDYMAAHYHYDTTYSNFYPANILTQETGVCQAYAYLFQYLMNRKGIECYTTGSDSMNHAWNMLKIGNCYYHIDITWDDPLDDRYGEAQHNYFLLSDATMQNSSHNHYGWELTKYACSDASYEDDYFVKASSPVVMDGSNRYYIDSAALECYNVSTGSITTVAGTSGWSANTGLWEDHGKLFYNSSNAIMTYDLSTGKAQTYAGINTANGSVYGSLLKNNTIYYAQQNSGNVAYANKTIGTLSYTATHVYANGSCKYCGKADPNASAQVSVSSSDSTGYLDIPASSCYYKPITWAVNNGIATPVSSTSFGGDKDCTRAEAVTFMWRAAGKPSVSSTMQNPFTDVSKSDYYYEAVLWAVKKGITTGVSETSFAPNKTCTRAQIITFVNRWAGNAKAASGTVNAFKDVSSGAYYYNPVLWGVGNKIVNGTGKDTFSPDKTCTRAQILTFIYRYKNA